jgi:hypothetical protein
VVVICTISLHHRGLVVGVSTVAARPGKCGIFIWHTYTTYIEALASLIHTYLGCSFLEPEDIKNFRFMVPCITDDNNE